ncbi:uncharacterized protein LOC143459136 isoform X2 [Clavelina lepadiformis]|uniref:uncharacterized protein LOC143459136 isoform X2 n=1 Tax=Clavelina lepadiformis TaxID=159417 RepID=UPI0040414958
MPQYLALDYLSEVVCQKEADINRMMITSPSHFLDGDKNNNLADNLYRKPWMKGFPAIDSKEMISEAKKELREMSKSSCSLERNFLVYDGIEFHISSDGFEEVIPDSVPSSDTESFQPQNGMISILKSKQTLDEVFSRINDFSGDEDIRHFPHEMMLLEPLSTDDDVIKNLLSLDSLLSKLDVMNLPDPTEEVDDVISDLVKFEHHYETRKETHERLHDASCDVMLFSPLMIKSQEIDEDILIPNDLRNETNHLNVLPLDDNLSLDKQDISSVMMVCASELASCAKMPSSIGTPGDIEDIDLKDNLLTNEEIEPCVTESNEDEASLLEIPLFLDITCTTMTPCLDEVCNLLHIKEDDAFPDLAFMKHVVEDFNVLKQLSVVERQLNLCHHLPTSSLLFQVPCVEVENAESPTEWNYKSLQEIFSLKRDDDLNDFTLCWNPVMHANDDMNRLRRKFGKEAFSRALEPQLFDVTLLKCSEEFCLIRALNDSEESKVVDKKPAREDELPTVGHSSILETENKKPCQATTMLKPSSGNIVKTSKESADVVTITDENLCDEKLNLLKRIQACGQKPALKFNEAEKNKLSVKTEHVDPRSITKRLDDFMRLRGVKTEVLPWKKTNRGLSAGPLPAVNSRGENLGIKRIRFAKNQQKDVERTTLLPESKKKSLQTDESRVERRGMPDTHGGEPSCGRSFSRKHDVCLTGRTVNMMFMIEREVGPLLEKLCHRNLISHTTRLLMMSREESRFILKQQDKLLQDQADGKKDKSNSLYAKLLHILVSILYLIVHVSYTTALALLHTTVQELEQDGGFKELVDLPDQRNLFRNLMQNLRSMTCDSAKQQVVSIHPKLIEVKKTLLNFFEKESRKKVASDIKVLVISCTSCRYLFSKLCRELNKCDNTLHAVAASPDQVDINRDDVLKVFERYNVLIIPEQTMFNEFPWKAVALVVDYEYHADSAWEKIANKFDIPHISFHSIVPNLVNHLDESMSLTSAPSQPCAGTKWSIPSPEKQPCILVGSSMVAGLGNLLHLLETRHDIVIMERDYNFLPDAAEQHPDIIIDPTTCILLANVSNNLKKESGDERVKSILGRLTTIRRKFSTCHVIVTSESEDVSPGIVLSGCGSAAVVLAKVQASVRDFESSNKYFQVKVSACSSTESLSNTIASILDEAFKNGDIEDKKNFIDRSWLNAQMSPNEQLLLHIPSMNSLSAQFILSKCTPEQICLSTLEQLTLKLPGVPENVLKEMLTYVQDKHEVKMQAAVSMHPGTSGVSSRPTSARTSTEGEGRPVSRPVNAAGASGHRQATGVQAQFNPWQFNHRVGNERGEFPHQARGYLRKKLQKVDDQVENFPKRAKFDMAPSNSSKQPTTLELTSSSDHSRGVPFQQSTSQQRRREPLIDLNPAKDPTKHIFSSVPNVNGGFPTADPTWHCDVTKLNRASRQVPHVTKHPTNAMFASHAASLSTPEQYKTPFPRAAGHLSSDFKNKSKQSVEVKDPTALVRSNLNHDMTNHVGLRQTSDEDFSLLPSSGSTTEKHSFQFDDFHTHRTTGLYPTKARPGLMRNANMGEILRTDALEGNIMQEGDNGVLELMETARDKLKEFVKRNPSRCAPPTHPPWNPAISRRALHANVPSSSGQRSVHLYTSAEHQRTTASIHPGAWDMGGCRLDETSAEGASGSVNIGIAQAFRQRRQWNGCGQVKRISQPLKTPARGKAAVMTPHAKRKLLTYEKVPGNTSGQTRLTFY